MTLRTQPRSRVFANLAHRWLALVLVLVLQLPVALAAGRVLADDASGMACCRKGQRHSCCHRKRPTPGAVSIGSVSSCPKECCCVTSVTPLRTLLAPAAVVIPVPLHHASIAPVSAACYTVAQCNPSAWQRPPPTA